VRIAATIVGLVLLFTAGAPSQILFESDYGAGTINLFPTGGAPNPFATGLAPSGLAFDNRGNLFAGDGGGGGPNEGRILKFTPDGSSSLFAFGLWSPFGLAFNDAGVLFVDDYNNNIYEYTPQGVRSIFASGLDGPGGLAFDASGNLFVSEWNSGDIDRFTPDGVRSTFASGFNRPGGLASDSAGDLFVVEAGYSFPGSGAVYKISPGGIRTTIGSGMFAPASLAFDAEGNLFVTDTWNGRILEFSPDGTEKLFASGLNLPTYLAFQPIGSVPPPTITCPAPLMLECENGVAVATIQVTAQEANKIPVQVVWTVDNVPYRTNNIPGGGATASTNLTLTATFGTGEHLVGVSASNGAALTTTCSTTVTVNDTIAPKIVSISAAPNVLWPPNKNMIPVLVTLDAIDNCDPSVAKRITQVTSNEPQELSTPDWEITGALSVNLRADRLGKGHGRIYTIQVQCEDSSGNISYASVAVVVPHDKKRFPNNRLVTAHPQR